MITNYFKNLIQNDIFREDKSMPTSFYIALSSTAPNADGTGITEPIGNGYARVKVDKSLVNFTESVDGNVKNANSIIWNESTAPWGTMTHFAIYDALLNGNMLFYGELKNSRIVEIETQMEAKAESIEFILG